MTQTCPLVSWYKFHKCEIKTCKNYTKETKHQCVELDRRKPEGTKHFSDAELNLYKFKSRGISTRLVQIYRKDAIDKVKSILTLQKFIAWLDENFTSTKRYKHPALLEFEKQYPLKIRRVGWKNWMWRHIADDTAFKRFKSRLGGECTQQTFTQLLVTDKETLESIIKHVKGKRNGKTHKHRTSRTVRVVKPMGNESNRRAGLRKRDDQYTDNRRQRA